MLGGRNSDGSTCYMARFGGVSIYRVDTEHYVKKIHINICPKMRSLNNGCQREIQKQSIRLKLNF